MLVICKARLANFLCTSRIVGYACFVSMQIAWNSHAYGKMADKLHLFVYALNIVASYPNDIIH